MQKWTLQLSITENPPQPSNILQSPTFKHPTLPYPLYLGLEKAYLLPCMPPVLPLIWFERAWGHSLPQRIHQNVLLCFLLRFSFLMQTQYCSLIKPDHHIDIFGSQYSCYVNKCVDAHINRLQNVYFKWTALLWTWHSLRLLIVTSHIVLYPSVFKGYLVNFPIPE